ncbi:MAG TPA: 3-(3-hydroxyphenyl)propionate hydroxylase, partial [Burkholderiaceae bacterium]
GLSASALRAWRRLGARFVQIDPRGTAPGTTGADTAAEDVCGTLMPFTVPVGWMAIVRPDRFVLHDGPAEKAELALEQACALFVGGQAPGSS